MNREAFEKARAAYGTGAYDDATLEFIFPQLKESEEERNERMRKRVIESLVCYRGKVYDEGDKVVASMVDEEIIWMRKQKEQKPWKVGANAYFTPEQKPAEWSEEEENALNYLHELIGFGYTEKFMDAQTAADMREWVNKSLRPQPHWKPSEEHLSALLAVFNDPNNIGSQTCQLALTDLYEQLKKL